MTGKKIKENNEANKENKIIMDSSDSINDDFLRINDNTTLNDLFEANNDDQQLSEEVIQDEKFQVNWDWNDDENIPMIWPFEGINETTSTTQLNSSISFSSLKLFDDFFDDDFWNLLVQETNRYASQTLYGDVTLQKSIDSNWVDTNKNEMQVYLALCILMTQMKKPSIHMNWTKKALIETPIYSKFMTYKRFQLITRFLHFSDNENSNSEKLKKIDPILTYFNNKFKSMYTPKNNLSLDESLMKFKGKLAFKQFNPSKRARFGIKFYKICESSTGYCSSFKIYTGEDKDSEKTISASENIVLKMMDTFFYKGYTLFIDNWYSSPHLFYCLLQKKVNVIGTVRSNRKNMPKILSEKKLKKGEVVSQSANGILALKWKDKKDVYMLSTKHKAPELTNTEKQKYDKKNKETYNLIKPACVIEYNHGMGGVDRHDQVLACFGSTSFSCPMGKKMLKKK